MAINFRCVEMRTSELATCSFTKSRSDSAQTADVLDAFISLVSRKPRVCGALPSLTAIFRVAGSRLRSGSPWLPSWPPCSQDCRKINAWFAGPALCRSHG